MTERNPQSVPPLTPAIFHIMIALAEGPRHGYAIMQDVEALTSGRKSLGPGTLYRSIQKMLVNGLIVERDEAGAKSAPHEERRRYYELTDLGLSYAGEEAERLRVSVEAAAARGLLRKPGKAAKGA